MEAIDEISVTDGSKSHHGVRQCRDHTDITGPATSKRNKFDFRDHESVVQLENGSVDVNSPEDVASVTESATGDHVLSSPCYNNGLRLDLKAELSFENATSMLGNGGFRTEASTSGEISLDSDKLESISVMKKRPALAVLAVTLHRKPPVTAAKTPTPAEIDEFFSVVEKEEQKRLSDKYNFDFVNDVPLDGRYEWVRLKP